MILLQLKMCINPKLDLVLKDALEFKLSLFILNGVNDSVVLDEYLECFAMRWSCFWLVELKCPYSLIDWNVYPYTNIAYVYTFIKKNWECLTESAWVISVRTLWELVQFYTWFVASRGRIRILVFMEVPIDCWIEYGLLPLLSKLLHAQVIEKNMSQGRI